MFSEGTDKMETKKVSEQQLTNNCDDSESKVTEGSVTSRRTFTRNVLIGSAVLLTLSNRSAWGNSPVCFSTNLLMSYGTGQASALTTEEQQEINDYEDFLNDSNNNIINVYEDINGDTCYEIGSSDEDGLNLEDIWFYDPEKGSMVRK